ncbi:MAG TPA: DUF3106 domain-containing protein [Piscinibacter sp.]|uniref:DUF3106 domain-containing protein n=1 Tax=Piscinibacter sp. TaxID=1903157 RepID=UPI0011D3743F|nr:DUF3106 domain-containing protein [Piscinibacter sp.]TXH54791.1 MAG: DUF3106 domain-containing protein [Burkholderiaceae bacterium]MBP5990359.1 DUF3106 domain-containing protein [Piscinibacter sp.]MBP6028960.1 DUF3106 domain-containing protein [Piscinibacter sp.]HMZ02493.1 DUF3106 domain-containing protein [Burkholderiaceae bacterium]HNJ84377.1 DUF3106 domain-containing protein [Piscinibacter sp.]
MSPRLLRLRPLGPAALLAALVMGGLLVVAPAHGGGAKAAATAESGPRWQDLSASQRSALKPLERDWAGIDASRKQKWLEIANRYPSMPQAERERIGARMSEWVKLSPAERGQARLNFQNARQITPEERQARWQAYQSLSPEERNKLAERAAPAGARRNGQAPREGIQNKSNIVPNPSFAASPRPVAPSMVQAAPGATTTLISKRPAPPSHQQPGLPKIAATPNFVDKQTLLPQRGAQGAAVVPPAATQAQ